jgi:CRISPR system Cascade subunit CasB
MWPFYVSLIEDDRLRAWADDWRPPAALEAEHHALALYGLHQQSQRRPMHGADVGVGHAVRALRQSGRFSEEAVDRRFAAAATATTLTELVVHLRGLVSQMRSLTQPRPLDYTQLVQDLAGWSHPERQQRIRRRWGGQYFAWSRAEQQDAEGDAGGAGDQQPPGGATGATLS